MRTKLPVIAALAACLAAWSLPARSGDYPYSGFFTQTARETTLPDAQPQCALYFFVQDKDGSYVAYHLDMVKFYLTALIRYVEWSRGRCVLDSSGKIETCTSTFDADPAEQGKSYIDVPTPLGPDIVDLTYFDTVAQAEAHVQSGATSAAAVPVHLNRCLDFDADKMTGYITADRTTLPLDQLRNLIGGDPDKETMEMRTEVLDAIRAGKGK